ncbi:hypothetical protein AB5J62_12845 [Amycolatopsis sp. cg5]
MDQNETLDLWAEDGDQQVAAESCCGGCLTTFSCPTSTAGTISSAC